MRLACVFGCLLLVAASCGSSSSPAATGSAGTGGNGSAGTTGAAGRGGTGGASGTTGAAGAGVAGTTGIAGSEGAAGTTGAAGTAGSAGAAGTAGSGGSTGSAGTTGAAGTAGAAGSGAGGSTSTASVSGEVGGTSDRAETDLRAYRFQGTSDPDLRVEASSSTWTWALVFDNAVGTDTACGISLVRRGTEVASYSSALTGGTCSATITRAAPNVGEEVEGTFSGVVSKAFGTGDGSLTITNGRFRVTRITDQPRPQ
jgi:hypothetical protein